MSKLDNLLEAFDELDRESFNYNRDYAEVIRQLDELSFIAEIDHDNYYLSLLEQIFIKNKTTGVWDLVTLNDEQREEFYLKNRISTYPEGFRIACSLHIYISAKEKYVQIFNSRNIIKEFGDPKDDYGKVYIEFNKDAEKRRLYERAEFKIPNLPDEDIGKKVYEKLLKVFELSKTNTIDIHKFDFKVRQDMSEHWGNVNAKDKLIDDEYQESARPELIKLPQKHTRVNVDIDIELKQLLVGIGFDEIDYENNGVLRTFGGYKEAADLFYSIVDFINAGKITPRIHPLNQPQQIKFLEKHYLSGKWPTATTEEEADKLKKELTRYEVYVTKFHDEVILKLEVWEMGIVYVITNVWDRRSIN